MSLANSIKTHVKDPLYFNQQRCEFRLDKDKMYLSNIRLVDIGMTCTNATDARFPYSAGAYAILQKISLLNDNVEIASLSSVSDYLGWANLQRTNANAYNMARRLNMSNLGYDLDARGGNLSGTLSGANDHRYSVTDIAKPQEGIPQVTLSGGNPEEPASVSLSTDLHIEKDKVFTLTTKGAYTAAPTAASLNDASGGTGATFTVQTSGTSPTIVVDSITCTAEGSGFTGIPTLQLTDGTAGASTAVMPVIPVASMKRSIKAVVLTNGSGYREAPSASYTPALDNNTVVSFSVSSTNTTTIFRKDPLEQANVLTGSESTTPRAWLDLKIVLPFLKATPYLNSSELQNLRLVVEFASAPCLTGTFDVNGNTSAKSIIRPSLIVDEVINMENKVKNPTIQYVNLDSEKVVVNQMGDGDTLQQVNQRLRGFDSKTVHRMLMVNKLPDAGSGLCGYSSPAFFQENYQFNLDGKKLLPYQGIDSPAKKSQMLNDSWGSHLAPAGTKEFCLDQITDILNESELQSRFSYGGFSLKKSIDELQLEYKRSEYKTPTTYPLVGGIKGATTTRIIRNHPFKNGEHVAIDGVTAALETLDAEVTVLGQNSISVNKDTSGAANNDALQITATSTIAYKAGDTPNKPFEVASKARFDMLFWGEVVKTMRVQQNKVTIAY